MGHVVSDVNGRVKVISCKIFFADLLEGHIGTLEWCGLQKMKIILRSIFGDFAEEELK